MKKQQTLYIEQTRFLPHGETVIANFQTGNTESFQDYNISKLVTNKKSEEKFVSALVSVHLFGGPGNSTFYTSNKILFKLPNSEYISAIASLSVAYEATTFAIGRSEQKEIPIMEDGSFQMKKEDNINASSEAYVYLVGYKVAVPVTVDLSE
ncbi:hypothetical protein ABK040_009933 [Willaertia magna]